MARKPRAHLHQRAAALASSFTETSRLCSRASIIRARLNEGQVLGSLQALTDDRNVVGSRHTVRDFLAGRDVLSTVNADE